MKSDNDLRAKTSWVLVPCHLSSFVRILLVAAVLLADTALAQPTKKPNEDSVVDSYDSINKVRDVVFKCGEIMARVKKLEGQVQAWETLDKKFFGPLGDVLTVIIAGTEWSQGQHIQSGQTVGWAVVDKTVCGARKDLCPAWMIGRTAGEWISMAPKWFGADRTVNDVWTDLLESWVHPDPTPADLQKLYDLARQKQHALRALMESQQREKVRCEAKDDKAELGIQKALDAALSRVRQRSSEIPGESEATAGGLSDAGPALPSFEIEPRRGDGMSMPPVLTMPGAAVKQQQQSPIRRTAPALSERSQHGQSSKTSAGPVSPQQPDKTPVRPPSQGSGRCGECAH